MLGTHAVLVIHSAVEMMQHMPSAGTFTPHAVAAPLPQPVPEPCLVPLRISWTSRLPPSPQNTCCNYRFKGKDDKCGAAAAAVTLADSCRDSNRAFRVLRSSTGTTCRCKNARCGTTQTLPNTAAVRHNSHTQQTTAWPPLPVLRPVGS